MFIIRSNGEVLFFNEVRKVWTDHPNVYMANSVYYPELDSNLPKDVNVPDNGTLYRFLAPLNGVVTTELMTHTSWLSEGCSDKAEKLLCSPIAGKLKFNPKFIKKRFEFRPLNWRPEQSLSKFHPVQ